MGIATLGPEGTDSENAARHIMQIRNIPGEVVLCRSFYDAIEHAIAQNSHCLIPAAFSRRDKAGGIIDTWGNVNFRELERLDLVDAIVLPLKEMGLARNNSCSNPRTIALHPSTDIFAEQHAPGLERIYIDSKPLAVIECSDGRADACIGSVDVIEQFPNLTIERRLAPKMVWTLYQPRSYR